MLKKSFFSRKEKHSPVREYLRFSPKNEVARQSLPHSDYPQRLVLTDFCGLNSPEGLFSFVFYVCVIHTMLLFFLVEQVFVERESCVPSYVIFYNR